MEEEEIYPSKQSNSRHDDEDGKNLEGGIDKDYKFNDNEDGRETENDNDNNDKLEMRDLRNYFGYGPDALNSFLSKLPDEEQHRYEAFRRVHLTKGTLVQSVLGHGIASTSVIVIQSAGKLFVGELVKIALKVQKDLGNKGPLQPEHLREAVERFKMRSSIVRSPFIEPGTLL